MLFMNSDPGLLATRSCNYIYDILCGTSHW